MATKEFKMDQDQMDSIEVYDPAKNCHFRILFSDFTDNHKSETSDNEEITLEDEPVKNAITIWTQNETLALINIFSLYKDKFKNFKRKKGQWSLISEELAKLGIQKAPDKCEIKWKNLLRVYRQHKQGNKGPGKFEFFNELDDIISKDPQFRYIIANTDSTSVGRVTHSVGRVTPHEDLIDADKGQPPNKKKKCSCLKSEKQKRHEDRMALMTKKMEIEERKVRAFEDYLKFLKRNSENT